MMKEHLDLVREQAESLKLDPVLMAAIVTTESNWDPNAMRFEAHFFDFWQPAIYSKKLGITTETESTLQKFSYGLCQLMGANFRFMGFDGPLPKTLDPEQNVNIAFSFFQKRCNIYAADTDKISAYNAGKPRKKTDGTYANQDYVDKVLKNRKAVSF